MNFGTLFCPDEEKPKFLRTLFTSLISEVALISDLAKTEKQIDAHDSPFVHFIQCVLNKIDVSSEHFCDLVRVVVAESKLPYNLQRLILDEIFTRAPEAVRLKLINHKNSGSSFENSPPLYCTIFKIEKKSNPQVEAFVQYLIEQGADVNLTHVEGLSPLYVAALRENLYLVKLLLQSGANPNQRSTVIGEKFTPLEAILHFVFNNPKSTDLPLDVINLLISHTQDAEIQIQEYIKNRSETLKNHSLNSEQWTIFKMLYKNTGA